MRFRLRELSPAQTLSAARLLLDLTVLQEGWLHVADLSAEQACELRRTTTADWQAARRHDAAAAAPKGPTTFAIDYRRPQQPEQSDARWCPDRKVAGACVACVVNKSHTHSERSECCAVPEITQTKPICVQVGAGAREENKRVAAGAPEQAEANPGESFQGLSLRCLRASVSLLTRV